MYSGQTMMQAGQSSCGRQMRPCVEYDRQIRYLDYMENGQRSRGAGFVKLERRDDRCNISLQVSGLYRKDHFTRPLLLLSDGEERELGRLQLADGGIKTYLEGLDSNNLDGQGLKYERLTGLRIPISEGKEIRCLWSARTNRREQDQAKQGDIIQDIQTQEDRQEDRQEEPRQEDRQAPRQEEPAQEDSVDSSKLRGAFSQFNSMGQAIPKSFKEDKWEQLWSIYPHIHPFSDGREYLSFGPSDLIVLPTRYYKLANNSFLLHGYYNYHHLIFTKVSGRNSTRYYIGVPGNLNQTERRTAIMFGFESFECDREPAGEGDFGYYLIPVEL